MTVSNERLDELAAEFSTKIGGELLPGNAPVSAFYMSLTIGEARNLFTEHLRAIQDRGAVIEECAKVAENYVPPDTVTGFGRTVARWHSAPIAAAIRKLALTPPDQTDAGKGEPAVPRGYTLTEDKMVHGVRVRSFTRDDPEATP